MMSQAVKEKSSYWEGFLESAWRTDDGSPRWLRDLRWQGLERFRARGFPTTDEEDWKYTNVAPTARGNFRPGATRGEADIEQPQIDAHVYEEARGSRLVF